MHQICYNFWNKGSQPELINTLGICPFFFLNTSLAALIYVDGTSFSLLCAMLYLIKSKATTSGRAWTQVAAGEMAPPWWAVPVRMMCAASSAALRPPSHFRKPHAKHSWWPGVWDTSAFGTWGYRRTEGLQWFAAQMHKNMHLYIKCQGRDPKPESWN